MQRDISIQEALTLIAQSVQEMPPSRVSVMEAQGCICAEELVARVDCPSATAALKDGFAVNSGDLAGASPESPVTLHLAGQINAGQKDLGAISPGQTMRVMTGARLPQGADAVLPSEWAREEGEGVVACEAVSAGSNLLLQGRDVRAGAVLVAKGQTLRPAACGLLAAAGHHEVPVFPLPRVSILATGDELAEPGCPLSPAQVYASNMVTLSGWLRYLGLSSQTRIVPDDMDAMVDAMRELNRNSDVMLTCGGAWKSGRDMTLSALDRLGWSPFFHRVRMGPGKAAALGLLKGKPVMCLPGGPPSNEMAFLKLAVPVLRRMAPWWSVPFAAEEAVLTEPVRGGTPGWTRFCQARLFREPQGRLLATPLFGSSRLHSQADADAIVEVPEGVDHLEAGTRVVVDRLFPLPEACAPSTRRRQPLPAVFSIVGKSDAGKTTVIEGLIPELKQLGLRVGTIKHDVHGFEMDHEGKDSYRHKKAGAAVTLISSPCQIGMVRDVDHDHTIAELLSSLGDVDIVLTEGYRLESWPKIEVHRKELNRGLISGPEDGLMALVTDEELAVPVPQFSFADLAALARRLASKRVTS